MDERVERLLDLEEAAIGRNDIDQAEEYRYLAGTAAYLRRQEAKDLNKTLEKVTDG